MDDRELTLREVERETGIHMSRLRHAIADGQLSAEKRDSPRGPYWIVTRSALAAYLDSRRPRGRPRRAATPAEQEQAE